MEHKGFPSEGVKPEGVLTPPTMQEVNWKVPEEIWEKGATQLYLFVGWFLLKTGFN